jgi:hypothetical protein
LYDAILAKDYDFRGKKLGQTLKAATFTGYVISMATTVPNTISI